MISPCTPGDTSGTSSPAFDGDSLNNLATATFDSLYAAIRSSKGTLFEEGLRIAQQYGMSDFAMELQQLQSQRQMVEGEQHSGGQNGSAASDSVAKVLEQPFELKEIKPGFDSGIGDDSLDGEMVPCTTSAEASPNKGVQSGDGVQSTAEMVENGVQTVSVATLVTPAQSKGDKPELKRKGDNLEMVPSRPPSRRNRSSQSGGVA